MANTNATNKMAVTLSQYTSARQLFQQHYFLADCDTNFGGQEISLPWNDLQTEVDAYIQSNNLTADDVAVKLVICYNPTNNSIYLRMQLATLVLVTPGHYSLDTSASVWYEITEGQIGSTQDDKNYDQNYLDYFYYCDAEQCSNASLENLASDTAEEKYVRNVVLPWGLEILPMYNDNQNVDSIVFGSCSFTGQNSGVTYPHTFTLFLMDSSKNVLMDNNTYQNTFEMKGCDLSTLCPMCCNCYNVPQ